MKVVLFRFYIAIFGALCPRKSHLIVWFLSIQGVFCQVPTVGFLDAFKDETLAQANQGYWDALAEKGFSEKNGTLKVIYRNAQGDIPTLVQITDYFISQKVDIIAANPTLSFITAAQKTREIPVCMMVCSHPRALGLADKAGNYAPNIFGIYDTQDYIGVSVKLIQKIFPKARRLGVLYNQTEPQSVNALAIIRTRCKDLGWEVKAMPVSNSSETQLMTEALVKQGIDAFFAMPDNIVFSSFEVIDKVCNQANIPVFTSEEGLVKRGALAAYGADMYRWGYDAGLQTAAYLQIRKIPILAKVQTYKRLYNAEVSHRFGVAMDTTFKNVNPTFSPPKNQIVPSKPTTYNNFYLSAIMLGLGFSALALGIFISMRIFDIPDITTDGSYTLGAVVSASLLLAEMPLLLVLSGTITAGMLAGICTGLIHTRLKVNALLAGILVMTALYSVNLSILGKSNVPLSNIDNLLNFFTPTLPLLLSQLFLLLLFTGVLWAMLSYLLKTDFGLAMRATGNSESMIRANGVNTNQMKIIGLGLANAFTALSGFLIVQYQGFADINMGIGIVIVGLGSVMIGETFTQALRLRSIQARLLAIIGGTILFRLILAFALDLGLDPNWLKMITAILVLVVVALPNLRK